MEKNITNYITNPLNAFLLIKRATSEIELITERFPKESKDFLTNISEYLPSNEDLFGAAEGLIRLQVIYNLKSEDFANGIIDGSKLRSELSAHDLFVIGEEAYKINFNDYFVKEYLQLALSKVRKGLDTDKEVNVNSLLSTLCSSYNRTGDYVNAIAIAQDLIQRNPDDAQYIKLRETLIKDQAKYGTTRLVEIDPYSDYIKRDGKYSTIKENILYSQVCRGNLTKSPKELSALKCRFVSNSPFSKLAPFKIEEANLDPYLVLFIDILSDSEMEFLKGISKPNVKRASTLQKDLTSKVTSARVAQLAWHSDGQYEVTERISRRVEVYIYLYS